MIAVFNDNTEHILNDLTVEEWRIPNASKDAEGKKGGGVGTTPLWEGLLGEKMIKLRVATIKGVPFLTLKENDAQLCQLRLDTLDEDGTAAIAVMKEVGEGYVKGRIERCALKDERGKLLTAYKKSTPKGEPPKNKNETQYASASTDTKCGSRLGKCIFTYLYICTLCIYTFVL